jgi:hypothetical protein
MAAVHAVEIADGKDGATKIGGDVIETVLDVHA